MSSPEGSLQVATFVATSVAATAATLACFVACWPSFAGFETWTPLWEKLEVSSL